MNEISTSLPVDLMSKRDVAQTLLVSLSWVDARLRERRLPHYKLGRRVLISREHIKTLLDQAEVGGTAPPKESLLNKSGD